MTLGRMQALIFKKIKNKKVNKKSPCLYLGPATQRISLFLATDKTIFLKIQRFIIMCVAYQISQFGHGRWKTRPMRSILMKRM